MFFEENINQKAIWNYEDWFKAKYTIYQQKVTQRLFEIFGSVENAQKAAEEKKLVCVRPPEASVVEQIYYLDELIAEFRIKYPE